jgi:hypothetical protein
MRRGEVCRLLKAGAVGAIVTITQAAANAEMLSSAVTLSISTPQDGLYRGRKRGLADLIFILSNMSNADAIVRQIKALRFDKAE